MKSQLVALLGQGPVETLNALAQLIALLVGAVLFYQSSAYQRLRSSLVRVATLKQYIHFEVGPSRFGFGVGTRPALADAPRPIYLITAVLIVALLLFSGHTPAHWAVYPFKQALAAVTVWAQLSLSWNALLLPFKSILLAIWSILSLLLIWTAGFAIPFKALLFVLESVAQALTPGRFNFLLFATFVMSGLIILATGNDLLAPSR